MYKKPGESENKKTMFRYISDFLWFLSFPVLFTFSLYVSWLILSSYGFFYSTLYDHTELESFIDTFAPQNNFKPEFSQTDREERIRLFSEVLKSVNHSGKGLEYIQFSSRDGKITTLLREPEVEHLHLVSLLVKRFKQVGLLSGLLSVVFILLFKCNSFPVPGLKKVILVYASFMLLALSLVIYLSPLKVFEGLHELVFPEGHQWFFYYQDSLMTTLMMAPKLFSYFLIIWMLPTILLFIGLSYAFVIGSGKNNGLSLNKKGKYLARPEEVEE